MEKDNQRQIEIFTYLQKMLEITNFESEEAMELKAEINDSLTHISPYEILLLSTQIVNKTNDTLEDNLDYTFSGINALIDILVKHELLTDEDVKSLPDIIDSYMIQAKFKNKTEETTDDKSIE